MSKEVVPSRSDFDWRGENELRWLVHKELLDLGVQHAFVGRTVGGRLDNPDVQVKLKQQFGLSELLRLTQKHGDVVIAGEHAAMQPPPEGDAFILQRGVGHNLGYCVVTADCLPIILASSNHVAVIHAGWRGLANRIITKACAAFPKSEPVCIAVIGPAAEESRYEVGEEVVSAIGDHAQFVRLSAENADRHYVDSKEKFLLDLKATAAAELQSLGVPRIASSDIGTIGDERFYSYRREGAYSGQNVCLVVP
jgi:polyphenol oxidase